MTKGDNINLFTHLNKLGKFTGVKFAYAVAKNLALLKPEYEALIMSVVSTEEYNKYDKERVELAERHAKKDENGKAISKDNKYELEDEKAFEAEFETLKDTHKEAIEARRAQIEEQNELLKTESTITLYKVKLEDLPKDISVVEMNNIMDIVEG
jgi:hypothetical protein